MRCGDFDIAYDLSSSIKSEKDGKKNSNVILQYGLLMAGRWGLNADRRANGQLTVTGRHCDSGKYKHVWANYRPMLTVGKWDNLQM